MPVPIDATAFPDAARADPRDQIDYVLNFGRHLEEGELVSDYDLALPAESVALGLTIMEGGGRDHYLLPEEEIEELGLRDDAGVLLREDCAVKVWLAVDPDFYADPAFNVSGGASLPIEATYTTNSVPARTRQRTALLKVIQQ
jgi:hypothetical protein